MTKTKIVNLSDWYHHLTKKEKSKFLDYMFIKYQMRPNTLSRKLSSDSRYKLSTLELNVIFSTIENGDWNEEN